MEAENKTSETGARKSWFDRYYKLMFIIPIFILILSLTYLFIFYSNTGNLFYKDVSLSGGTSITINGDVDGEVLISQLKGKFPDVSLTKLIDLTSRKQIAILVESSAPKDDLKLEIEKILGYPLTEKNSSIEFTGSTLSESFYKQLLLALLFSFILMSIVIFVLFRSFIPSIAVIFAAFADIVMPLALLNFFGFKISAAGIAAFLMLIGYSVDTDILLTSRAVKNHEGTLNSRIYGAFKTGILMTLTALAAVLPAFFLITGLPDSFKQIFLILAVGLTADIFNTWLTNTGIIKWYCEKKGIK